MPIHRSASSCVGTGWPRSIRSCHAAFSCVLANAWSTAALVTGPTAPGLLAGAQVQARLLDLQGDVTYVGGWPADAEGVTEQQARTSGAAVAS